MSNLSNMQHQDIHAQEVQNAAAGQQPAPTQNPQRAPNRPAQALPSLEQPPEDAIPAFAADATPDVMYVLDVMNQCIAHKFADGGDTRYVAQNAFATARQALGVLVAQGLIESTTTLRNGEPLWLSPAVPPMGAQPRAQM